MGICTIETQLIASLGFPELKLAAHESPYFTHNFCLYTNSVVGKKVAYGKGMVSPEALGDKIPSDLYLAYATLC